MLFFLGNTASIIWGMLHCDFKCNFLLSSIFCYWHFWKYFLQNKIEISEHEAENIQVCLWLKHFSFKSLNAAACKH